MVSVVGLGFDRFGNHPLKQNLNCHRMRAAVMGHKKFAVASIGAVIEGDAMIIVVAMKSKIKSVEEEAISLLRVTFGFLSLTDHTVVHFLSPFRVVPFATFKCSKEANGIGIKKAREDARALWVDLEFLCGICSHTTFTSMKRV